MNSKIRLLFAALLLVFITDLNYSIGIVAGISYVLIIIAASRYTGPHYVYLMTLLASALLLAAALISFEARNYSIITDQLLLYYY